MHFILEGALYVEWWSLVIAINTALPTNSRTGQPVMVRKSNHPMVCNCILGGKLTIAMGLALKMIIIYQQNLFISCARTYLEKACAHRVMCAIQHPTWNVHTSQRGEREGERGGRWEKKRKRDDRTEVTHAHISNLPKGWEKWINSYLSPDLALKQSVDLLVLTFFIESKPLQQNGDGKKDQVNGLLLLGTLYNPDMATVTYLTVSWLDHGIFQELHKNQIGDIGQTSLVVSIDRLDGRWIGKGSTRLHVHDSGSTYIFLVDVRKKDTLLSILSKVEWILPVLCLDKTENRHKN